MYEYLKVEVLIRIKIYNLKVKEKKGNKNIQLFKNPKQEERNKQEKSK